MRFGQPRVDDDGTDRDSSCQQGVISYTIFWKENPSVPLVRIRTIQASDLETTREAAHFLIFEETNTVAVVLTVVEDEAPFRSVSPIPSIVREPHSWPARSWPTLTRRSTCPLCAGDFIRLAFDWLSC